MLEDDAAPSPWVDDRAGILREVPRTAHAALGPWITVIAVHNTTAKNCSKNSANHRANAPTRTRIPAAPVLTVRAFTAVWISWNGRRARNSWRRGIWRRFRRRRRCLLRHLSLG